MIRRPPRSTQSRSSAASDVYKRQLLARKDELKANLERMETKLRTLLEENGLKVSIYSLSLIHISEPTRLLSISYAVFCLKNKKLHPSLS